MSPITKLKISKSLTGKKASDETKAKMSKSRSSINNPFYGRSLPQNILDAAAALKGWAPIPFSRGYQISDMELGLVYILAISSIGVVGIILAGWSALAETNRPPFDLVESESELVSGAFTEYSSFSFALIFLGEYGAMISMSALITILFLGGFLLPFSSFFIISENILTLIQPLIFDQLFLE
ncbi:NADH-quinone oxidoreductase subunit H [Smittium mucronatum]|uniref:NADH-quinone oxidoreductase subunit H n=1 Tax=Smittium mucronatum TaxID=133383 RepID=A0A1R0GKZ4_9FUNG|nr:NADH-quinone oxidoreductase subunit H [Smittium mucronatum]